MSSNDVAEQNRKLPYIYAQVKQSTRKCMDVFTATDSLESDAYYEYVRIDRLDFSYLGKYYINGAWYEDAAGTIPWSPST